MEINENKQAEYVLGLNENKIGGVFELKATNTKILLKITVTPNSTAIF